MVSLTRQGKANGAATGGALVEAPFMSYIDDSTPGLLTPQRESVKWRLTPQPEILTVKRVPLLREVGEGARG